MRKLDRLRKRLMRMTSTIMSFMRKITQGLKSIRTPLSMKSPKSPKRTRMLLQSVKRLCLRIQ